MGSLREDCPPKAPKGLLNLDESLFRHITSNKTLMKHLWIVGSYTPWCLRCGEFLEYMNSVSSQLPGNSHTHLAALNCHFNQKLCDELGLMGHPMLGALGMQGSFARKLGCLSSGQDVSHMLSQMKAESALSSFLLGLSSRFCTCTYLYRSELCGSFKHQFLSKFYSELTNMAYVSTRKARSPILRVDAYRLERVQT